MMIVNATHYNSDNVKKENKEWGLADAGGEAFTPRRSAQNPSLTKRESSGSISTRSTGSQKSKPEKPKSRFNPTKW